MDSIYRASHQWAQKNRAHWSARFDLSSITIPSTAMPEPLKLRFRWRLSTLRDASH